MWSPQIKHSERSRVIPNFLRPSKLQHQNAYLPPNVSHSTSTDWAHTAPSTTTFSTPRVPSTSFGARRAGKWRRGRCWRNAARGYRACEDELEEGEGAAVRCRRGSYRLGARLRPRLVRGGAQVGQVRRKVSEVTVSQVLRHLIVRLRLYGDSNADSRDECEMFASRDRTRGCNCTHPGWAL